MKITAVNKKAKILLLSIILSVILFVGIMALEKSQSDNIPKIKVVYCIRDIQKKEPLKPEYFAIKEIDIFNIKGSDIAYEGNYVKSLDQINGMYAKENIYAGEPLNKNRIGTLNDAGSFVLNPGERETAISFENIADCVGGTIRKDDKVDLIFTNNPNQIFNGVRTETEIQGIRVLGVIDKSEKYVDKDDKTAVANTLLLAATPEECHLIENLQRQGKIKVLKVPDNDKAYSDIIIENGKVVSGK